MLNITVTLESSGLDAIVAGLAQSQGASPPGPIRDMYMQWGRRAQGFNEERFDRFSIGGGDWAPLALSTIRARRKASREARAGNFNAKYGGSGLDHRGARSSIARITMRTTDDRPASRNVIYVTKRLVSAGRTVSILKDSGILRQALKIGSPGSTFEMVPSGFVYGVDGNTPHPGRPNSSSPASAAASLLVRSGKSVGRGGLPKTKGKRSRGTLTIGDIAAKHQVGGRQLPKREVIVVPDQTTVDAMAGDAIQAVLKLAT